MYKAQDYLCSGLRFAGNLLRPRRKRLSSLMIYATTRCQSRCLHCAIWKKPEAHLSLADIERIMQSRCVTPQTTVGLEGGEFVLHPQAEEILAWFAAHHPNYTLLSNCLAPEKVIRAVRRYRPHHLYVSLDGDRETYSRMRGRDGYDRVLRVVRACKAEVPVSLMFCLSPFNGFRDMEHVIRVAEAEGVDVRIGIYGNISFFDTEAAMLPAADDFLRSIPESIRRTQENFDFVALYDEWRKGRLRLRCHSILSELVVHSDGNVPLCQNLPVSLGNIHRQSLDDIFNSPRACALQSKHSRTCNACWINYHRKFDIILLRTLERLLPKPLIEKAYGPYQWCADRRQTYRRFLGKKGRAELPPEDGTQETRISSDFP